VVWKNSLIAVTNQTAASFVPHDQAQLIALYGGPDLFVKRLNYLHDKEITYIGNEPAFLTVLHSQILCPQAGWSAGQR
jgi:putative alpha-1,2-mannosidase